MAPTSWPELCLMWTYVNTPQKNEKKQSSHLSDVVRATQLGTWRLLQSSSLFKIGGGLEPAQLQLAAEKVPYFFQNGEMAIKGFHEIICRIEIKKYVNGNVRIHNIIIINQYQSYIMYFPSDAMTWQDCSGCQTKQLKKDFQCHPWSQVSWLVWQTPGWASTQYSKGLLPKSIRTASWRSKVVPEGQKTSLKVDECCHLLSSWSEKCSLTLCSSKSFAPQSEQRTVHTKTSWSLRIRSQST